EPAPRILQHARAPLPQRVATGRRFAAAPPDFQSRFTIAGAVMSVLDRFRLDGKRLFITGGSRGLGREMALAIAEAGASVVLVGRDQASLDQTAAEIRQRDREAFTIVADVGKPVEAERACQTALDQFGPIDILINNVGGRRIDIPTTELPVDKWQSIIDLNLTSTFVCTKLIGGAMVKR